MSSADNDSGVGLMECGNSDNTETLPRDPEVVAKLAIFGNVKLKTCKHITPVYSYFSSEERNESCQIEQVPMLDNPQEDEIVDVCLSHDNDENDLNEPSTSTAHKKVLVHLYIDQSKKSPAKVSEEEDQSTLSQSIQVEDAMQTEAVQTNVDEPPSQNLIHIWKTLECPVCYDVPFPPVPICNKGHHVCNKCRKQITECPLCKSVFTDGRNFLAESLVKEIPLPCKYKEFGCKFTSHYLDKEAHELICSFHPYECQLPNCKAILSATEIVEHFRTTHPENLELGKVVNGVYNFHFIYDFGVKPNDIIAINIPEWGVFELKLIERVAGTTTRAIFVREITVSKDHAFRYSCTVYTSEPYRQLTYCGPVNNFWKSEQTIVSTFCLTFGNGFAIASKPNVYNFIVEITKVDFSAL